MEKVIAAAPVPALQMEDVTAGSLRDPGAVVAEEINWTVAPGEYWVVAGLQASGKSDFLMMAGSLTAPLRGRYRLFGEDMPIFEDQRLKARLRLGLVFDGGELFNNLSVAENVALPLRYHRNLTVPEAEASVRELLEAMELTPWADHVPATLARNWQKRAGLARALALQPEVLLVDNPLAALDLRHTNWWLGFLDQLSKGHPLMLNHAVTLVVTTADLRSWKGHARQFAILKNKRLSVLGTWEQLRAASRELLHELLTERMQTE
jgi:ABC-type transporter Mla maintaining outer membrane lipid asymmetry ATPase subunit MlaF